MTGILCLRCAGLRVLSLDSGEEAPALGFARRIGPYEIIEELGRGGMGRVYAARQIGLGRIVALKAITAGLATPAELEMRFLREAQTIARLHHPNIVAVHDSGRADGYLYFSMDYVEGGDLSARMRSSPLGYREAAGLVSKVADALEYAHGQGVLHRDLKPSNILMEGDEPRLADFGLAAELESGGDLTRVTSVLGTPHYLAPEAISRGSAALSVASDVYALGVILFQLLTGRTPFAGATPAELPSLLASAEPPSPRLLAPAVPRDLETICLKCLERDPSRRYASAAALAGDLRRFLAGEPIVARPVSELERLIRWCRRSPTLAAVWLLLFVLAVGSTTAALWIGRARAQTVAALRQAHAAEAEARERIREAKLAEARAVRRANIPGWRDQALAALAEAARIRPGLDLRNEAAAALVLPDVRPMETWAFTGAQIGETTTDNQGDVAAHEVKTSSGSERAPAELRRWGAGAAFQRLDAPGTRAIGPLRFSLDGRLVMERFLDQTLRVWRVGVPKPILVVKRPLPTPDNLYEDANDDYDFSPDGAWVALGLPEAGGLTLIRVGDGGELGRWAGGQKFTTIRVSPDGRHVAAMGSPTSGRPGGIFLFDAPSCRLDEVIKTDAPVEKASWSADSRLLAAALTDDTITLYDRHGARLIKRAPMPQPGFSTVQMVGNGTFILERGPGLTVYLVPAGTLAHGLEFDGIGGGALQVDPASDIFCMITFDDKITRWRVLHPEGWLVMPPPRIGGYRFGANGALDFSPDGRWIANGQFAYTVVRDAETGRLAAEIPSGARSNVDFGSTAFSPDGRAVLRESPATGLLRYPLADDGDGGLNYGPAEVLDPEPGYTLINRSLDRQELLLANLDTGAVKVLRLEGNGAVVQARWIALGAYGGAFSPDGDAVILNSSGQGPDAAAQRLRVYRTADGSLLRDLGGEISCDADWSRDGRTVLTSNGSDKSILWNAADWTRRLTLSGRMGGNATSFSLSPDGSYAVIQGDRYIHFVSTTDGAVLVTIEAPEADGYAIAVKFAPDGRRVAVLWADGRIDMIRPGVIRDQLGKIGLGW